MADFLMMGNACGQNLLRLVARGNAVIAELMRLKDYIPPVYRLLFIVYHLNFTLLKKNFSTIFMIFKFVDWIQSITCKSTVQ